MSWSLVSTIIRTPEIREYKGVRYAFIDETSFAYLDSKRGWRYIDLSCYNVSSIEQWIQTRGISNDRTQ